MLRPVRMLRPVQRYPRPAYVDSVDPELPDLLNVTRSRPADSGPGRGRLS
jgi:hypothetical protein